MYVMLKNEELVGMKIIHDGSLHSTRTHSVELKCGFLISRIYGRFFGKLLLAHFVFEVSIL